LQHGDPRVKTQSYVDVRRRRLCIVPFLEASCLETRLDVWQWWWLAGGVALRVATVVVRLARVGKEVHKVHGGVASGWRAWCSCDLGDD
jgi:hypothetical protein